MDPLDGLPDRQRGYIRTLVEAPEFVYRVGAPNLDPDGWVPDAILTTEQVSDIRKDHKAVWDD